MGGRFSPLVNWERAHGTMDRSRLEEIAMKKVLVRYKVKADRAAENENYIANVFEQLHREKPAGLHYATFKLDDGVSFVHLVSVDGADAHDPLPELSAFRAFVAEVRDRCEEPPVSSDLHEVGSYAFFGA
jgi:hypothetical protein